MSQVRPILWMIGITASGFLLLLLLLGTRRGERKAKLSSKDLGTLAEIKLEDEVLDARITNVRVLYVVVQDDKVEDSLAQRVCQVVKKNGALAEAVRIVKPATPPTDNGPIPDRKNNRITYTLLEECNCSAVRIK